MSSGDRFLVKGTSLMTASRRSWIFARTLEEEVAEEDGVVAFNVDGTDSSWPGGIAGGRW